MKKYTIFGAEYISDHSKLDSITAANIGSCCSSYISQWRRGNFAEVTHARLRLTVDNNTGCFSMYWLSPSDVLQYNDVTLDMTDWSKALICLIKESLDYASAFGATGSTIGI